MLRFLPLALFCLALTGCRTYGERGNVEATYAEIVRANAVLERTIQTSQAEALAIERAARADARLAPVARAYGELLREQAAALALGRRSAEQLDGSGDYRKLNQAYGAIITEHQKLGDRYAGLVALASGTPNTTTYLAGEVADSRYYVVPPQYYAIANRNRSLTVANAARGVGASSGQTGPQAALGARSDSASQVSPQARPDSARVGGAAPGETYGTGAGAPPAPATRQR